MSQVLTKGSDSPRYLAIKETVQLCLCSVWRIFSSVHIYSESVCVCVLTLILIWKHELTEDIIKIETHTQKQWLAPRTGNSYQQTLPWVQTPRLQCLSQLCSDVFILIVFMFIRSGACPHHQPVFNHKNDFPQQTNDMKHQPVSLVWVTADTDTEVTWQPPAGLMCSAAPGLSVDKPPPSGGITKICMCK